jgi:hypothetical protein
MKDKDYQVVVEGDYTHPTTITTEGLPEEKHFHGPAILVIDEDPSRLTDAIKAKLLHEIGYKDVIVLAHDRAAPYPDPLMSLDILKWQKKQTEMQALAVAMTPPPLKPGEFIVDIGPILQMARRETHRYFLGKTAETDKRERKAKIKRNRKKARARKKAGH